MVDQLTGSCRPPFLTARCACLACRLGGFGTHPREYEPPRSSLLRRNSPFGYEGRKLRGIRRKRIIRAGSIRALCLRSILAYQPDGSMYRHLDSESFSLSGSWRSSLETCLTLAKMSQPVSRGVTNDTLERRRESGLCEMFRWSRAVSLHARVGDGGRQ